MSPVKISSHSALSEAISIRLDLSPFRADFPDTLVSSFVQNIAKA